ncbi:hypothetical protein FGB62_157g10 [Gracilaria domingensis]|nr:hypothetical protein FGB62_157g10 [Gracilaria domingensis]
MILPLFGTPWPGMAPPAPNSRNFVVRDAGVPPPRPPRSRASVLARSPDNEQVPEPRRDSSFRSGPMAPSTAGAPPGTGTPATERIDDVVETHGYSYLEAQLRVSQLAKNSLFEDLQYLRRKLDQAEIGDTTNDILVLRQDVNSILKSLGAPAAFVQAYHSSIQEHGAEIDRLTTRFFTLEEIIRMYNASDAKNAKEEASKRSARQSLYHGNRRSKKELHYSSDSSSSNSSVRSAKSTSSSSSDSEEDRERAPDSYGSSDIPSSSTPISEGDPALYMGGTRVQAAPLAYATNGSRFPRPGWVNAQPQRRPDGNRSFDKSVTTICHICYRPNHIAPVCMLPARELPKIIGCYESLSPADRARVPSKNYEEQRAKFGNPVTGENVRTEQPRNQDEQVTVTNSEPGNSASHSEQSLPSPANPAQKN